jgi:hypothetical protein
MWKKKLKTRVYQIPHAAMEGGSEGGNPLFSVSAKHYILHNTPKTRFITWHIKYRKNTHHLSLYLHH